MQRLSAGVGGSAVDRVTHRALIGRQRRRTGRFPLVDGGGQPTQFVDVMSEHRVDDTRRENVLADVPIHHDAAVEFGDLSVERNLRALRDDPARRAESLSDVAAEQLAKSERAGEHHRGEHRGAPVAAKIAQYRETGITGMRCRGPHRVLHCVRS